ncbi:MAG: caspase family protein [Pseudomonadota bacterium]
MQWRNALRQRKLAALVLLVAAATQLISAGHAQNKVPHAPIARPEPGKHLAPIKSVARDRAGRWLVSGSADKTARLWDLATGKLLRTTFLPQDLGNVGSVHSVTMAPDGSWYAAGGITGFGRAGEIYVFERRTGALKTTISVPETTFSMVVSQDGKRLAAAGYYGVKLFRTSDFSLIAEDSDYNGPVYSVDLAADGRMVTTEEFGALRLYRKDLELVAKTKKLSANDPFSVKFSPDGKEIGVGYYDNTSLDIVSGQDLKLVHKIDTTGMDNGDLNSVSWTADGRFCGAGSYDDVNHQNPVICWSDRGRGPRKKFLHTNITDTPSDFIDLGDGGLAIGSADPVLMRINARNQVVWSHRTEIADFRGQRSHGGLPMRLSKSGTLVEFGWKQWGKPRVVFDPIEGRLAFRPQSSSTTDLEAAKETAPELSLTGWRNGLSPKLDGKPLKLRAQERSRSIAIAPDEQSFLLGADWSLQSFDRTGERQWTLRSSAAAWSTSISGDGRLAVAGFGDGTLRWYRMKDGQELLRAFFQADGRWAAWTPEGFFSASPGSEDLIGYVVNRSSGRMPEFVWATQLRNHYYRPDLVAAKLAGNEDQIREALAKVGDVRNLLSNINTPKIEQIGPERVTIKDTEYVHKVRVDEKDAGNVVVRYRINGREVRSAGDRALKDGRPGVVFEKPLTLDEGCSRVEARAERLDGSLASETIDQEICVDVTERQRPRLFALFIGISDYYDGALALKHAASDAERFRDALKTRAVKSFGAQSLYEEIRFTLLSDSEARKKDVVKAFERLAREVKPHDTFIVYFAGHGFATDGRYHFVPQDAAFSNRDALVKASLSEEELIDLIGQINTSRSLILLDTCYGGAFEGIGETQIAGLTRGMERKAAIDRFMRQSGRAVLAASTDVQTALEGYEHNGKKYGLFTWVLLQGLAKADQETGDRNGLIGASDLYSYLKKHVPEISKRYFGRRQIPMGRVEGSVEFAVAD